MTWTYVGQAEFSEAPLPVGPSVTVGIQPGVAAGLDVYDQLLLSTEVDEYGRLWVVSSVDEDMLDALLVAAEPDDADDVDSDPSRDDSLFTDDLSDTLVYQEPLTWFGTDCDSDGWNESWLWDAESRSPASNPMTAEEDKTVFIAWSEGLLCSGVLVDDRTVLTAGHCLYDDSGRRLDPRTPACVPGRTF